MPANSKRSRGMTLLEAVVSSTILFMVLTTIPGPMFSLYQIASLNRDKAFATQKATQMLEELRAFVHGGGESAIMNLDTFDDGADGYRNVLTTDPHVVAPPGPRKANPADRLSNNLWASNRWKFLRQVRVQRTNQAGARQVSLRVFYSNPQNPLIPRPGPALAEVTGLLQTVVTRNVPTQVYDIYALDLANVPGRWQDHGTARPLFNKALDDLAVRNFGFQPRLHLINRLSYGRDPYYAPYTNEAATADSDNKMRYAYLYPGRVRDRASGGSAYYYLPADLLADGPRLLLDGAPRNGYAVDKSGIVRGDSLGFADQFNHAVRFPEELATYNRLRTEALAAGTAPPEPSLRLLMEQLNDRANRPLRNALVVNLHGELQPLPPLRNYADPARDPDVLPGVRVVAHPERLEYPDKAIVKLRVYSWLTDPADNALPRTVPVITVFMPAVQQVPSGMVKNGISVTKIKGNAGTTYAAETAEEAPPGKLKASPWPSPNPSAGPGNWPSADSDYQIQTDPQWDDDGDGKVESHYGVLITLYNTPTTSPAGPGNTGLPASARLFGMEYIPNPIGTAGTPAFSPDLTAASNTRPKNTARWIISIDRTQIPDYLGQPMLGDEIVVETRIGTNLATGVRADGTAAGHPFATLTNLSRTYVWYGVPAPLTERHQVLGDPRYNPYLDVQSGNRYNWFFDSKSGSHLAAIKAGVYPNFGRAQGPGWDQDDYDVASLMALWREGLMSSGVTYGAMTGYTTYYAGLGGEIGASGDTARFDVNGYAWNRGNNAVSAVQGEPNNLADEIAGAARLVARTDHGWFAMPWLGELYPDDQFAYWRENGNLRAPASAGSSNKTTFYRAPWDASFTRGVIGGKRLKRLGPSGAATFFNGSGGTRAQRFDHADRVGAVGPLSSTLGAFLSQAFNLSLPTTIVTDQPFQLSTTTGAGGSVFPPEWGTAEYLVRGTSLSYLDNGTALSDSNGFYKHVDGGNWTGSAGVRVGPAPGSLAPGRAQVLVSGLAPAGPTAGMFAARYTAAGLLQTFFAAGDYDGAADDPERTVQLPRVEVQAPVDGAEFSNPAAISLSWNVAWRRWDGQPYAANQPGNWAESTPLQYQILYSADNGKTWRFAADSSEAKPGIYDPVRAISSTSATIGTAGWPRGSYLLQVEAYRIGQPLHYAYHQREIYINRLATT